MACQGRNPCLVTVLLRTGNCFFSWLRLRLRSTEESEMAPAKPVMSLVRPEVRTRQRGGRRCGRPPRIICIESAGAANNDYSRQVSPILQEEGREPSRIYSDITGAVRAEMLATRWACCGVIMFETCFNWADSWRVSLPSSIYLTVTLTSPFFSFLDRWIY